MQGYSIGRDFKRFCVEFLCLLMVLYGAPLQALEAVAPPASERSASTGDRPLETVASSVESGVRSGLEAGAEHLTAFVGQPWAEALGVLLALGTQEEEPPEASSTALLTDALDGRGAGAFDAVPPLPPSFRERPGRAGVAGAPGIAASPEVVFAARNHLEAIPLLVGWNLLSIPEEPADPAPGAVLSPIAGSFTHAFAYDACDPVDPWKLYDPADAAASDLFDLDPTKGFFIEATAPVSLPSSGTLAATTSWQLCTGWNLIGFPAGEPRHIRNALQSIEGKYIRAFGFDPADPVDPWEIWDVTAPDWANDLEFLRPGYGYWVLVTEDTTLEIANEGAAPTVAITSPADLGVVTAPTEIRGTVESAILESWNLAYRLVGESAWIELATGNFPVVDAPLATFDPTLLLNGLYEVRLEAVDTAGTVVEEAIAVVVEGNMKIGHFTLAYTDLNLPVSGLDIEIIRTYDSRDRQSQHDFGQGWSLDILQGSYINNRPPGDGWLISPGSGPVGLPCSTVQETKSHITTIRLSDQEVYNFRLVLDRPAVVIGGCFAEASFEWVSGPLPGTILEILGENQVFAENNSGRVVIPDTLETFEPERVRLTTVDGRIFHLDLDRGVTHLEDLNGNALDITPTGITHSSGKGIEFVRDTAGRIVEIIDPMGNSNIYEYDAVGDLVTFTNRVGASTRFTYAEGHFLEEVENPLGIRSVRTEYDDEGRVVRILDAVGNVLQLGHDIDARQEVITNRLGQVRVLNYDDRGNVIRETDELGHTTVRTFGAGDLQLTETDPLGHTQTRAYDAEGNLTTVMDPLGNTVRITHGEFRRPLTLVDPVGNTMTNVFDSRGNLTSLTDAGGASASFGYDTRGQLSSETDALGRTTSFVYDADGNPLRTTDALGNERTMTFDANGNVTSETTTRTLPDGTTTTLTTTFEVDALGRVTKEILPDGSSRNMTYSFLGLLTSVTDPRGNLTTFSYDGSGRPTAVLYADGTSEFREYDAEGRLVAGTDRAGRTTTYGYDAVGRQTLTRFPDGATQTVLYDAAGRPISVTDPRGFTTTTTYDAAGRRTAVQDGLGNSTQFTYDANGRETAITDPLGNSTRLTYSETGRILAVELPDGQQLGAEYDILGRRVTDIDPAGQRTSFTYDALDRVVKITDALGGTVRHEFDEVGNRISETDANGHVTRFTYDALGRQTGRILPDGASESIAYDAAGNPIRRTDFKGQTMTFAWDVFDRLIERTYPDGTSDRFTYTPTGARATATDARGTTTYSYDSRDRLTSATTPEGLTLTNVWDTAGNRTALIADLGAQGIHSTSFTYDALGRMMTVTDAEGGTYAYGYDAAGRRTSLSYPNGVVASYAYDALGRLLHLHSEASDGTVIQDYSYTLGPAGNRQSMVEGGGTVRTWEHDALYRLTRELVTDDVGALMYDHRFAYDAVGNRIEQVRIAADGTSQTTSYSYDLRDRLQTAAVAGGTTSAYGWDANGNLINKTDDAGTTFFGWDDLDRLVSVTNPDGTTIANTYDVDGVRMSARTTPGNGDPPTSRSFVTDIGGPLSQVVAEITDNGELAVQYARGEELLGLLRDGEDRYAHGDHIGSVRALTDPTAAVEDLYTYEAHGRLLAHTGSDPNSFLFAGQQRDEVSGLDYLRARWMDPTIGSFVSLDPLKRLGFTLPGYSYADGNPVDKTDPTGLISAVGFTVASVISGIVIGMAEAYLTGNSVVQGAFIGGLMGLLLGPIAFKIILAGGVALKAMLALGVVAGVWGVFSALREGNKPLAVFRGVTLLAGLLTIPRVANYIRSIRIPVEFPNITRGDLIPGDYFNAVINSRKGPINFGAWIRIEGETLHLQNIAVFHGSGKPQTGLIRDVFRARGAFAAFAKRLGFGKLRFTGIRDPELSTSANPGKLVDKTMDLSNV